MTKLPKIGAHVKTAGGLDQAIANALRIGAQTIQLFGASPRQWHAAMPVAEEVEKYKRALSQTGVSPVFLHASYLVNLASPEPVQRAKSVKSLTDHLQIANAIGAQGLIFHMGSGKGANVEEALKHTIEGMKSVLTNVIGHTQLVMENSAGGGNKLGATASQLGFFLKKIGSPRVKVCFDTAHAFEAGILKDYSPEEIKRLFDEWDDEVGLENIVALHVNDSKTPCGSHHDRHENIGEGEIGLKGFNHLAAEKRLHDKAWILEVPGFDGEGPDKANIEILKSCFA